MSEKRITKNAGLRVETRADGQKTITGYAAVFYDAADPGTEYRLWENAYERIDRQAFSRAIAEKHDARALFNHDSNCILGRVGAGTCRLSVDAKGLRYEVDCPDTQMARDLCKSIERGDVSGSSFSFITKKRTWIDGEDGRETTVIGDLDLLDVSPVVYPAYEATTADVRSAEIEKSREEWRASQKPTDPPHSSPGPKLALLRLKEKEALLTDGKNLLK